LEHNIDNIVFEVDSKLVDINFPNEHILVFGLINEEFRILLSIRCKNSHVNFATREANVSINLFRVTLTSVLRTLVKETKNSKFALNSIIF